MALQARLLTCVWVLLEVEQFTLDDNPIVLFMKLYVEIVRSLTSVRTKYTL